MRYIIDRKKAFSGEKSALQEAAGTLLLDSRGQEPLLE